ncbi:MAG: deoxyribodipyrimidine photo-lyase [Bacteriovorax sp.]|nr:deoxyribodipyrimidine photo-lyase [Bacteriovorax sp.]
MKRSLCWIRRDLRLHDHYALREALNSASECLVAFIFDELILDKLHNKNDPRVTFIFDSLKEIEHELQKHGSSLIVRFGNPIEEIPKLVAEYKIDALFFNHDYEPYAKKRDDEVEKILRSKNVEVFHYKDHVFFEKKEILNGSGEIYKVFTPYKNKWLETFRSQDEHIPDYKCSLKKLSPLKNSKNIIDHDWMTEINFLETPCILKGGSIEAMKRLHHFKEFISNYKEARDIPALEQTSNLSSYIRMGNLSIRDMIRLAVEKDNVGYNTWLSEIVWRDFYQMILDAFPHVDKKSFRPEYDNIKWLGRMTDFESWCDGQTGYPLVDSAMRCLNTTGMMHNRLRMVVASFLTKTLLIDWRLGEKYFAEKLLDYDMAANNGGWQWSASTGVDAQPYFRIFNPYNQSEKFDPKGIYIREWCPELANFSSKSIHSPHDTEMEEQLAAGCFIGRDYPHPIVGYKQQRDRALSMYKAVK